MRILCLVNNWAGWKAVEWLRRQRTEIAGVVLHPTKRRQFGKEIIHATKPCRLFSAQDLQKPKTLMEIRNLGCDMAISVFFGYILKPPFLESFPKGCINLHPAYLPYNRGAYPNVWSLVDETPAGVTLHYLNEGVDTGDVVAQQKVSVDRQDTGETLYRKLESASLQLFKVQWPKIQDGTASRRPQRRGGTFHRRRDVERIDEIVLDRSYKARKLINILRARTFPPHEGAYILEKGKKTYLRLQLLTKNEL